MTPAPIILFAYNRPRLARRTLESLAANDMAAGSELYIFSDGPRESATEEDRERIGQVRALARERNWCGKVHIMESPVNKGLAASVIDGVSQVIAKAGRVIVIEDDVLLSPHFLNYMNGALDCFENEEKILSIGSWNYFCPPQHLDSDIFYLRYPDSIAWATYARSWNLFEEDGAQALQKLTSKGLLDRFNADGEAHYFEKMLNMQIRGEVSSWAIRWTATSILHDKLNVFPRHSMSRHLGFGADSTHETSGNDYNENLALAEKPVTFSSSLPVKETEAAFTAWKTFVKKNFEPAPAETPGLYERIKTRLYRLVVRLKGNESEASRLIRAALRFPRYTKHEIPFRKYRISAPDFLSVAYQLKEFFEEERQKVVFGRIDPVIIDCGSNVGVSVLYFKSLAPQARIAAFEADPGIFALLTQNMASNGIGDVQLNNEAVWIHNDGVEFGAEGADGGSLFHAGEKKRVPSRRLKDVLEQYGEVDLLKMDIEGAEFHVLADCADVLHRVKRIFVEFHSFSNQPQALGEILSLLTGKGFRYYIQPIGERSVQPFMSVPENNGMDLQLEIYAIKKES
jgi:FkbM family methyltransferase